MIGWAKAALAVSGALLLAGCGAGEPQGDAAAAKPLAMWTLTTASPEARRQVEAGVRVADMSGLPKNRSYLHAANDHFKRAVTEDPSFAYAYLAAARTAPSFEEYRANLSRAAELAAGAGEAERLQVELEQRLFERDMEGALELAQRLVALEPSNPRAWMELAEVQKRSGQEEKARESAAKAVEVAPDFTRGHLWLANSYLFEPRDWSEAERHVRKALELEPDQSAPHDLQGDIHRAHGRFEEAAGAYTRAAELDPTDAAVLFQRGHVYTFAGDYEKARADYDAAAERARGNQRAQGLYNRALLSAFAGDPKRAVAELEEIYQRIDRMGLPDPDGAKLQALTATAQIALGTGQIAEARTAIERAAVLLRKRADETGTEEFRRATEATVAFWEGYLAAHEGDHATARAKAEEHRKLLAAERRPNKERPVHALLGIVALREKKYDEAIAHLEQAAPNDEYLVYQRALALEGAGRREEAQAIYRSLATNNFNSPGLAIVRRDALARAGQS